MGVAAINSVGGRDRRTVAAWQALGRYTDPHDPALIRQTAAQMVSETVFGPLLAEMRAFPFGHEYGQGGRGEAVFGPQLDQRVADAVAAAHRGGLAEQIARVLTEAGTRKPAAREKATPDSAASLPARASAWFARLRTHAPPARNP